MRALVNFKTCNPLAHVFYSVRTVPVWDVFNEKGCLLGSLCVSEAHAKERILVIFRINIVARQQALPSPDFSRPFSRFWRRQGRSRVRPLVYFLTTATTTQFRPSDLGTGKKGEHGGLGAKRGFICPNFIRKCTIEDKRLI